jgi:hypothetical protein
MNNLDTLHFKQERLCRTCRFCYSATIGGRDYTVCRMNPPPFPGTQEHWWCGQWQPKEEK